MPDARSLAQFYIAEEQSVYLLTTSDARKHRQWLSLCQQQLRRLGYQQVRFIGKGVFGFVFAARWGEQESVFKFARRTLPTRLQQLLADEAQILAGLDHVNIPKFIRYVSASGQPILQMQKAAGVDLAQYAHQVGPLPVHELLPIAMQLAEILAYLRALPQPVVHGDIKPSNLVFAPDTRHLSLVDWGSAVLAQRDADDQPLGSVLASLEGDQLSNARMGDVFFIGEAQRLGAPSSPRFDEQGVAATLYALASGQLSRFGQQPLPPSSLGLPKPLAEILTALLSDDPKARQQGGDSFVRSLPAAKHWLILPLPPPLPKPALPIWIRPQHNEIDTVAYSSRKSFLQHQQQTPLSHRDEARVQLGQYYRDYMAGMGDSEKAFVAAIGQLGHYPLLGGLALHWHDGGLDIDSSLHLQDTRFKTAFSHVVNNMVQLARSIQPKPQANGNAVFKACFFNARDTLHLRRHHKNAPFIAPPELALPFEISAASEQDTPSRLHSYFEDGHDPDETLTLPRSLIRLLRRLNRIHHTGCLIFEVAEHDMKIHSYLKLLVPDQAGEFRGILAAILLRLTDITDVGIAGFMKLPYKNTRQFPPAEPAPARYYPKDPRRFAAANKRG